MVSPVCQTRNVYYSTSVLPTRTQQQARLHLVQSTLVDSKQTIAKAPDRQVMAKAVLGWVKTAVTMMVKGKQFKDEVESRALFGLCRAGKVQEATKNLCYAAVRNAYRDVLRHEDRDMTLEPTCIDKDQYLDNCIGDEFDTELFGDPTVYWDRRLDLCAALPIFQEKAGRGYKRLMKFSLTEGEDRMAIMQRLADEEGVSFSAFKSSTVRAKAEIDEFYRLMSL